MTRNILIAGAIVALGIGTYIIWQKNAKKKVQVIKNDAMNGTTVAKDPGIVKVASPASTVTTIAAPSDTPSDTGAFAQTPSIINAMPLELANQV